MFTVYCVIVCAAYFAAGWLFCRRSAAGRMERTLGAIRSRRRGGDLRLLASLEPSRTVTFTSDRIRRRGGSFRFSSAPGDPSGGLATRLTLARANSSIGPGSSGLGTAAPGGSGLPRGFAGFDDAA